MTPLEVSIVIFFTVFVLGLLCIWMHNLATRPTGREALEQNRVRVEATNMRPEDPHFNH